MRHQDISREELDERLNDYLDGSLVNYDIFRLSNDIVSVDGAKFKIVEDPDDSFDAKRFKERYTDLFEKFDYIVGDMAYDKLRLRGFYEDDVKAVPVDMHISSLEDYLLEYCNFGVVYYVLKRLDEKTVFPDYKKKSNNQNYHKKDFQRKRNRKVTRKNRKAKNTSKRTDKAEKQQKYHSERRFAIREKDN